MTTTTRLLIIISFFTTIILNNNRAQSNFLSQIGKVDSTYSEILKENRKFWVQIPESFNPENPQKYPVAYVIDGDVHLKAVSAVHDYYSGGYIPEMIIVGISNRSHRTRDLTTSKTPSRSGQGLNQNEGEAKTFTQFIERELIPHIESNYPATNYRTLIGHSYGGLFTINTLIHHTHLFENYIAIDPSLDWDNQKLLKASKAILNNDKLSGKSLYISMGSQLHMQKPKITIDNVMDDDSDFTLFSRSIIEFCQYAESNTQNGLRMKWKFYENDIHGTIPLPSILDGLVYLFNWYPIEHTEKFNNPGTPTNELVALVEKRAQKLAKHFGYTSPPLEEDLLNMLGYMNMDMGQPEKSLAFFKLNIKYYPSSANAYDSISDYFIAQKDYKNALLNLTKAYDISGNDFYQQRIKEIKILLEKD